MNCPKCLNPIDQEAHSCYSCGYNDLEASLKYRDRFGDGNIFIDKIYDSTGCLRKQDKHKISSTIDKLESMFPQLFFHVYIENFEKNNNVNELGFWLLNHAIFKKSKSIINNQNVILLVLDVDSKNIGLSFGYFSEQFFSEEQRNNVLFSIMSYLINHEYGNAINCALLKLGRLLKIKSKNYSKKEKNNKKNVIKNIILSIKSILNFRYDKSFKDYLSVNSNIDAY